jgi:hypothetical protein
MIGNRSTGNFRLLPELLEYLSAIHFSRIAFLPAAIQLILSACAISDIVTVAMFPPDLQGSVRYGRDIQVEWMWHLELYQPQGLLKRLIVHRRTTSRSAGGSGDLHSFIGEQSARPVAAAFPFTGKL